MESNIFEILDDINDRIYIKVIDNIKRNTMNGIPSTEFKFPTSISTCNFWNMEDSICSVIKKLRDDEYIVYYVYPNTIMIGHKNDIDKLRDRAEKAKKILKTEYAKTLNEKIKNKK